MKKYKKIGSKIMASLLAVFVTLSMINLPVNASGKQQVTSTLDFSQGGEPSVDKLDTEGWKWELDNSGFGGILTLDGIDLSVADGAGIVFTDNMTIKLVEGSVNNIVSLEDKGSAITGDSEGYTYDLVIEGKGTLNISGGYTAINGMFKYQNYLRNIDNLTIDGSTINAVATQHPDDGTQVAAISASNTITLKNQAKVTTSSTTAPNKGFGIGAGIAFKLIDDGTLLVANGTSSAIQCMNRPDGLGKMTGVVITGSKTLNGNLVKVQPGPNEPSNQILYDGPTSGGTDNYVRTVRLVVADAVDTLTINTVAPVTGATITDGTNTTTGLNAPTVTWSDDNGATWSSASGNFKAGTTYQTKYVYTAKSGYVFDCEIEKAGIIAINKGTGTVSAVRSDYDKTLTVIVTWSKTAEVTKYDVTVNGGTGSAKYAQGDTVTITAGTPASGKQFKEWTVVSGGVTLASSTSDTTTFTMPANAVEVTATYEDIPVTKYGVTVNSGTTANTEYAENDTVTIIANSPASGKQFKEWTVVSGSVTLASSTSATTTFTMPANAVEVTATYEDIPHQHVADTTKWFDNDTHHWNKCIADDGEEMNKATHTYGAWVTDTEATETEKGSKHRNCTVFNHTETVEIPVLSHTHVADTTKWFDNDTHHWNKCTADDGEEMNKATHTYGAWVTDTEATETEKGSKHRDCTVCNHTETQEIPVLSHTHVAGTVWYKDNTNHWHECTAGDGEKMNIATHTYGAWVTDTEATETEKGSKHRDCTVCNRTETVEIPATGVTPEKPVITAGAGSTHQISNGKDMTLTCTGKLEDLRGIYVDGKLVDESNYTLKSGSTILTLKSSYLDTLSAGNHTLKSQYKDGLFADTTFTVKDKIAPVNPEEPKSPQTGDTSNLALLMSLFVLSGGAIVFGLKKKKAFHK